MPREVAEGMAPLVQEMTGMQVEVVHTPCKPNAQGHVRPCSEAEGA
jgi:hypothetical protein